MRHSTRVRAAALHLLISLVLAAIAAGLVFGVWYPSPFVEISGGQSLFLLLVSVDVVLGPLLTLAVFNIRKPRRELITDLGVIGLLQVAALLYGIWTVYLARPVYLVHEVDRFQVVTAAEVDLEDLKAAPPELQDLPWRGIKTIGVRKAVDEEEKFKSLELALAGLDVARRPGWWRPLDETHRAIMAERGKSLTDYATRAGYVQAAVDKQLAAADVRADEVWVFPVVARSSTWSVMIHRRTMAVVGYLPVDGF